MSLLLELRKIDRKAALIFNREIKLRRQRGELNFGYYTVVDRGVKDVMDLIDSFSWDETRQGWDFWNNILDKAEDFEEANQ